MFKMMVIMLDNKWANYLPLAHRNEPPLNDANYAVALLSLYADVTCCDIEWI